MVFLDQNFTLFRMGDIAFLQVESNMLKCRVNARKASVNSCESIFQYIILDLHQKQVHHWKEHGILIWKQNFVPIYFYLYAISALEKHGNTYKSVCMRIYLMHAAHTNRP
jgi:hypothetical protein